MLQLIEQPSNQSAESAAHLCHLFHNQFLWHPLLQAASCFESHSVRQAVTVTVTVTFIKSCIIYIYTVYIRRCCPVAMDDLGNIFIVQKLPHTIAGKQEVPGTISQLLQLSKLGPKIWEGFKYMSICTYVCIYIYTYCILYIYVCVYALYIVSLYIYTHIYLYVKVCAYMYIYQIIIAIIYYNNNYHCCQYYHCYDYYC